MKVFIAADMEGITGVESIHDVTLGLAGYQLFRRVMAGDVNAVVDGAFRGGADEVVVADGHALQSNLRPADVDPRATLKSGGAGLVQFKGLTDDVDAVLLVGFHAKSGTPRGILSHSFLSSFHDIRLDGRSVGEAEFAAYLLAARGIPVVFLSGDDTTIAQTRPVLGDAVEYVQVKQARGRMSGDHLPPQECRRKLAEGAARAVARAAEGIAPIEPLPAVFDMEIDLATEADDAMPDMLVRNARFSEAPDAPEMADFDFLRSLEPLDSPRPGTIRVTGDVDHAYRTVSRLCGHFMLRNLDWLLDVVAPRVPYERDLEPWRDAAAAELVR
jgi:D-amino peptidase